jgi:para-aminobenzoate synthetase component I
VIAAAVVSIALSPIEAAARLAGRRGRVLLDSGRDDDGCGAWSFLAADPVATLEVRGPQIIVRDRDGRVIRDGTGDPLEAIASFARSHGAALHGEENRQPSTERDGVAPAENPRPRVMGFFSYDLGRAIEKMPAGPSRGGDTPDVWLGAYDAVVRWPSGANAGAPGEIIAVDARAADRLLHAIEDGPRGPDTAQPMGVFPTTTTQMGNQIGPVTHVGNARGKDPHELEVSGFSSGPRGPSVAPQIGELRADDDGDAHCARVERIREYIAAGDVYQVNLARRLTATIEQDGDALALYAALGAIAPAPYGGLVETDTGVRVVSGSPERFLARAGFGQRLDTRPIKGTRRRTGDPTKDAALAADLAVHPKDDAEHLMIVDLERNDLGRVAKIGSVRVDDLGYVVELPGLYHKVSTVSCELRDDVTWADLLRAAFPGGSITGAPKIRAMEIIDELEPARRGPYCGAIGWLGENGAFALAIAIRVAVLVNDELRLHVGGGIVADSDPRAELQETEDKAAGWRAALQRP